MCHTTVYGVRSHCVFEDHLNFYEWQPFQKRNNDLTLESIVYLNMKITQNSVQFRNEKHFKS